MTKISFENKYNEKLVGELSKNNDTDIIVVFCHGFLSDKDSSTLTPIWNSITSKGFNSFKFDFSGNGESEGLVGDASYLKEREDLTVVIDYLESKGFKKICLVGHSMGASISIITTSEDSRVKWLVDLAGPAYPSKIKERRFTPEKIKEAYEKGSTTYTTYYGEEIVFNKKFFEDLENVDVKASMKKINIPLLIVHGTSDEAVDIKESEELFILAKGKKIFNKISGADHRFSDEEKKEQMVSIVSKWASKWVKE